MARKPTRMAGPIALTTSDATYYTAPAYPAGSNLLSVVRHIHISNPTGGTGTTVTLAIGTTATAANRILDAYSLAAGAVLDLNPYYVLAASETLHLKVDNATTNAMVVTIDGDENV
jgi:hypothetical protein